MMVTSACSEFVDHAFHRQSERTLRAGGVGRVQTLTKTALVVQVIDEGFDVEPEFGNAAVERPGDKTRMVEA